MMLSNDTIVLDNLGRPIHIRKDELIKILVEELRALDYHESAIKLEQESGYFVESGLEATLRKNINNGDWVEAEETLKKLEVSTGYEKKAMLMVLEQQYIELLENRQTIEGLRLLQERITPLMEDFQTVRDLSRLLMCKDKSQVREQVMGGDQSTKMKREQLLRRLQELIPSAVMLSSRRLECMLEQALRYQITECGYHNTPEKLMTLYKDHKCAMSMFPTRTISVFEHKDQVWYCCFSNQGDKLLSCGKDSVAIVWCMATFQKIQELNHKAAVVHGSWSPNDQLILTASQDHVVRLWKSGALILQLTSHTMSVLSCGWLPDSQRFITGGIDKRLIMWNISGVKLHQWLGSRVFDLSISHDGSKMVCCNAESVSVFDLILMEEIDELPEPLSATCCSFSMDSKYVVVNSAQGETHLWDLKQRRIIQKFKNHKQQKWAIKNSFGGVDDAFVCTGSEDHKVYIYHTKSGDLIQSLEGHHDVVNAVSWSQKYLASCSDDNTIRIWSN